MVIMFFICIFNMLMRFIFLIFGLMVSAFVFSQTDTMSTSAFEVVKEEPIASLPLGSFLFRNDQEYFAYLNSIKEIKAHPIFFSDEEMGLVINVKNHSRGVWYEVESVTETGDRLIVNLVIRKDHYQYVKPEENYQQLFIKLRKNSKELVVQETNEGVVSNAHLRLIYGK